MFSKTETISKNSETSSGDSNYTCLRPPSGGGSGTAGGGGGHKTSEQVRKCDLKLIALNKQIKSREFEKVTF